MDVSGYSYLIRDTISPLLLAAPEHCSAIAWNPLIFVMFKLRERYYEQLHFTYHNTYTLRSACFDLLCCIIQLGLRGRVS